MAEVGRVQVSPLCKLGLQEMRLGAQQYVVKGSMRWPDFLAVIKRYADLDDDIPSAM